MPEEPTGTAVTDATESPAADAGASSSAETQTADTPVTSTPVAKETPAKDYRALAREDPELARVIEEEANRRTQRALDRERKKALRDEARQTKAREDADRALEIVGRIADEPDDEDEDDGPLSPAKREKAARVQPTLDRLARREEYKALYEREGAASMNERYNKDPEAFANWVEDELLDLKAAALAQKIAPTLAKSLALDEVNGALQKVAVPPTGTGSADGLSLERYNADPAMRAKLRSTPEGRATIDRLMARALESAR